jgi:hypothetical protein
LLQRFSGMSSTTPGHPMGLPAWFQADLVARISAHVCDSSSGVKTRQICAEDSLVTSPDFALGCPVSVLAPISGGIERFRKKKQQHLCAMRLRFIGDGGRSCGRRAGGETQFRFGQGRLMVRWVVQGGGKEDESQPVRELTVQQGAQLLLPDLMGFLHFAR